MNYGLATGRRPVLAASKILADRLRCALRRAAGCVVAGVVLALLAGGCAGQKLVSLKSAAAFYRETGRKDLPVLVVFYKPGCPTCIALEPVMDQLADEYRGRVVVAKYRHVYPWFQFTSWEIVKKYDVVLIPTVLLFVDGQARNRWFSDYSIGHYREALDTTLRQQEVVRSQLAAYPLESCAVRGEVKLSSTAVNYVHGDQLVRLCCNDCVAEFKKDPGRYLGRIRPVGGPNGRGRASDPERSHDVLPEAQG